MNLASVYKEAEDNEISIFPCDIGFSPAATIESNNRYGIFIDFSLCKDMADYMWKLGHEVAHCTTGCTHKISSRFDLIEKHEHTAWKHEIETYLPVEEICTALQNGYHEIWELADYFGVPEEAIEKALYYWTECKGVEFSQKVVQ